MHRPISRRTALKASGIAVALPLLESMNPAFGREFDPPKRMVMICNALGFHPPSLFPQTTGLDYENTEYLNLIKKHRRDFTLFSGLSHPDQMGKEPHDTELTWLTAARNPGLGGFKNTVSVDQVAANYFGNATRYSSIALSSNSRKSQSYNSNGVMLPAFDRPSNIFARLFLQEKPREQKLQRQQLAEGRSILDFVSNQRNQLDRRASSKDRRQLDEYFSAIRQAESELTESEAWLDRPKPRVEADSPKDISEAADLVGRARAILSLVPLALQTDSTRVITVVIQDHHAVPDIAGVTSGHHQLSHHGQDPAKIKQLKIIEMEILKCFGDFLSQMSQKKEADSRLLDQTSILFGSNLGNANAHDPRNLPIILAGGGYDHGRYVSFDRKRNPPLCNLFVNMLNNVGVETDSFGTSNGKLSW